jgi:hypothetical protein
MKPPLCGTFGSLLVLNAALIAATAMAFLLGKLRWHSDTAYGL